jgi:predicted phosphodiesterase
MSEKVRYLFLGDFHVPFHDDKTIRNVVQVVNRYIRPDIVILLGDVMDFYSLSFYDKDPSRAYNLDGEIGVARGFLRWLSEQFSYAERLYLVGNHEQRLMRYLWRKAPELHNLNELSLSNLLKLDECEIRLVVDKETGMPADRIRIRDNFWVVHGHIVRKYAGASAVAMIQEYFSNGVSGHTHRLAFVCHRDKSGRTLGWIENGCLCTLNPEYVYNPNWQQGFSFVDFVKRRYYAHLVPVVDREPVLFVPELEAEELEAESELGTGVGGDDS